MWTGDQNMVKSLMFSWALQDINENVPTTLPIGGSPRVCETTGA
jgi:hypothetical protein